MKRIKKKKIIPAIHSRLLSELEGKAFQKGIEVHYDRIEASGLKLKGGLCRINGCYRIYIDKRKHILEKIQILEDYLNVPLSQQDIPEIILKDQIQDVCQ